MMDGQRADAGLGRKRETQLERVTAAIDLAWDNTPVERHLCCEMFAKAAIAAAPDPHVKKERDRPKLPTDDCVLCAMRSEFADLVRFIEAHVAGKCDGNLSPVAITSRALARALREQGVV